MGALIGGMGGGGGGGLTSFSFKVNGKDAPFYEAPAGYNGIPVTNLLSKMLNDWTYSAAASNPAAYKKQFGKDLPGFEGFGETGSAGTAAPPPKGFASEAERQAWLNANATPQTDYMTEWRKRRTSFPQTLLSGFMGDDQKLGG